MRITLILNPGAGTGDTTADELRHAIEGAGHEVETREATKGHLSEVLARPGDLIVVAGGDGTVGRIMRVLAGSPVPMTILPIGTANNIARSLGIRGEPAALAASWARLEARQVDVGTVHGPWGETRFVESAGIGLLGELIHPEVSGEIQGTHAGREAVRQLARTLPARHTRVEVDGEDRSASYLLLEAMNIRCVGPNLWLADHARAGDGKLEIVRALESDRHSLVALADAFGTSRASLASVRAKQLRIWCTADELHVDDRHGSELGQWEGEAAIEIGYDGAAVNVLM